MLLDKLERINRLRKEAMNNPEFLQAAQEHQQALEQNEKRCFEEKNLKNKARTAKSLSDIYQGVDVGQHGYPQH
ncbi:hypothetical protein RCJ22_26025 [Vibrio sp. FNV 38]|nr:hypothetical protein [Vibrio sp. FNV 38]